ncbi:MAG: hypothetical protein KBS52_03515 [Clostridiales bacterium]|nr:hypothetical protein [Candidatus Equinaster intestinalis]
MKKIFEKIKEKTINFCKWIWVQVKDWHNLLILLIVAAVFFCICVVAATFIMFLADGKLHIIAGTAAVLAFWAGPFTPFWPICIAATLGIRQFIDKIWKPTHKK